MWVNMNIVIALFFKGELFFEHTINHSVNLQFGRGLFGLFFVLILFVSYPSANAKMPTSNGLGLWGTHCLCVHSKVVHILLCAKHIWLWLTEFSFSIHRCKASLI